MIQDYEKLCLPNDMKLALENNPELIISNCDGVGSSSTWIYHLIPNSIFGLDVKLAANVHDWMYTFPKIFKTFEECSAYKDKADLMLYENLVILFEIAYKKSSINKILHFPRLMQAKLYFQLVKYFGKSYFWKNKKIYGVVNG